MSDLFSIPPRPKTDTQPGASNAGTKNLTPNGTDTKAHPPNSKPGSNIPVQSVSDVAQGVKRTVEAAFGRVRLRGEISRPNYHRSGHLYLTLKDDRAVIDAVCWKGQAAKLGFRLEEGMEVIATGKLTTYPGGSKYQIVVESMEIAGEGALLKMLEDRRKKLAAQGLFDDSRKQPIPLLPHSIGVVTSPTGAVIRDILHRLADRFPRDVLLWPVSVQGDAAAGQIAKAVQGFNALPPDGPIRRPDILIVGRGGGSLEDLWCFNEEVVVRAVADSAIPIISAVGHETDTTLIDFVADRRAPTPTGAAEMAVPVRTEELIKLGDLGQRLRVSLGRKSASLSGELEGLARGLSHPERLVQERGQALDLCVLSLDRALQSQHKRWRYQFDSLVAKLPHPREKLAMMRQAVGSATERLQGMSARITTNAAGPLRALDARTRMRRALGSTIQRHQSQVDALARILGTVQTARDRLMDQGYMYATDAGGGIVARAADTNAGQRLTLNFRDGQVQAQVGRQAQTSGPGPKSGQKSGSQPKKKPKPPTSSTPSGNQGTLL